MGEISGLYSGLLVVGCSVVGFICHLAIGYSNNINKINK